MKIPLYTQANPSPQMQAKIRHDKRLALQAQIDEKNKKHSLNGDPLSFYLESLILKLTFSQQDRTMLAEITEAELEVLAVEVRHAQEAKEKTSNDF